MTSIMQIAVSDSSPLIHLSQEDRCHRLGRPRETRGYYPVSETRIRSIANRRRVLARRSPVSATPHRLRRMSNGADLLRTTNYQLRAASYELRATLPSSVFRPPSRIS